MSNCSYIWHGAIYTSKIVSASCKSWLTKMKENKQEKRKKEGKKPQNNNKNHILHSRTEKSSWFCLLLNLCSFWCNICFNYTSQRTWVQNEHLMDPTLRMRTNPLPDTAVSVWGSCAEHTPSSASSARYCYHPHQLASWEKWKNTPQFIVIFTCQVSLKQFATGPC